MRKKLCDVLKSSKNPQKKIAMGMGDFQKIPIWVFKFYFWPILSLFLIEYPLELNSSIVLKGLWETKIYKKMLG